MFQQVNDDEVLRLMTSLGLDSENECTFRAVRHYFRHNVPPCCIAFNIYIWSNLCDYLPNDPRRLDRLIERGRSTGMLCIARDEYRHWLAETLGSSLGGRFPNWDNGYAPCPRCVLEKTFVLVPNECPCCADKAHDEANHNPNP